MKGIIRNIKQNIQFIILCLVASVVGACSDDHGLDWERQDVSDGVIDIAFNVPAIRTVATRAVDEEKVEVINVLIFENNRPDDKISQLAKFAAEDFTPEGVTIGSDGLPEGFDGLFKKVTVDDKTKYKLTIRLKKELIGKNNLKFYFISNHDSSDFEEGVTTLKDVKDTPCSVMADDAVMTMSAKVDGVMALLENEVQLIRSSAKITVTKHYEDSFNFPFNVFCTSSEASVLAGAENISGSYVPLAGEIATGDISSDAVKYVWPTAVETTADPLFLIIKAEFKGEYYYYRINLVEKVGEEKRNVRIAPNHWYKVEINSVMTAGYDTPQESLNHPASNEQVDYEIYDHAPEILNMTTDGIRELGVTHEIVRKDLDSDDTSERWLYVKFYSKNDGEHDSSTDIPRITKAPDWITIDPIPEYVNSPDLEGDYSGVVDTRGKMIRYKVTFDTDAFLGTLDDYIDVEWRGLHRQTIVRWEREFMPGSLCTAALNIRKSDGSVVKIEDYWSFIDAAGSLSSEASTGVGAENTPILYGIGSDANNGLVRDEGFHFPLLYGESGQRWSYSYDLSFTGDNANSLKDRGDFDWVVTSAGLGVDISPASGTHTKGQDDLHFTISRSETDDYQYSLGSVILEVTPKDGSKKSTIKLNTYHTGFFHYDVQNHRMDEKDPAGYYYYEVADIGRRYWLDRNLGAKSSRMYITTADGTSNYGDPDAAGGYYEVAKYLYNQFKDPVMYDESDDSGDVRVSPPGYGVPDQALWDDLRKSSRFRTEAAAGTSQSFYTSYYETEEIGNIYFPKCRFRQGDGASMITGETLTGYYWTKTPASGTEKEEIGRWLKTLVISGETTSYINGNVENYYMSVRCVDNSKKSAEILHTYFNVKGATHVYLYTGEGDHKTAVTTWPGQAVANYSTANDWAYFTYQSSMFKKEDLKVIFNHVDSEGKITTVGKKGNVGPLANEGWYVMGDPDKSTQLGGWWNCDFRAGTVSFSTSKPN